MVAAGSFCSPCCREQYCSTGSDGAVLGAMGLGWVVGLGLVGLTSGLGRLGCHVPLAGCRCTDLLGTGSCLLPGHPLSGETPALGWLSMDFQLNDRRACFKLKKYCLNSVLHRIEELHVNFGAD